MKATNDKLHFFIIAYYLQPSKRYFVYQMTSHALMYKSNAPYEEKTLNIYSFSHCRTHYIFQQKCLLLHIFNESSAFHLTPKHR